MAKQSISRKETQVSMGDSVGKQLEQTVSVDDNSLPSPQELQLYQQIDPQIIPFLIETSIKEQTHRHYMDKEKLKILKNSERKTWRINWWGMFLLSCFLFYCWDWQLSLYTSINHGLQEFWEELQLLKLCLYSLTQERILQRNDEEKDSLKKK